MAGLFKNLVVILSLLALAGIGYYLFVIEGGANLESNDNSAADAERESQLLIRQLQDVQNIELSGAIFSDRRFRSLVDFGSPVNRVPVGRDNPFIEGSSEDN